MYEHVLIIHTHCLAVHVLGGQTCCSGCNCKRLCCTAMKISHEPGGQSGAIWNTVFHALIVILLFMSCDVSAKIREVGRRRGGLHPPRKHNFYRLNLITLFYNHGPTLRQPPLPMHCQRWSKSNVVIMKVFLNLLCLKLSIICIL